ncbi:MAG: DUF1127 domain-containing protein [Rhodospirillales bacterium]
MSTIDTLPGSATHYLDLSAKQIGVAVMRLVGRALIRAAQAVYVWQERASQKRALRDLDARMLKDLGLSQSDVQRAFGPPVWHR